MLASISEAYSGDMRLGTWNVRSLYRAGSLITVAEEISKYKLDIVGVQEVRPVTVA
jgi:exonuclease III